MFSSGMVWVIRSSMLIFPSIYQSTICGTCVRPLAPPNAVPRQTRPVTSWNGRVEISWPEGGSDRFHYVWLRHAARCPGGMPNDTVNKLELLPDDVDGRDPWKGELVDGPVMTRLLFRCAPAPPGVRRAG